MDASASPTVDANLNGVYGFFLQIENSTFSSPARHKNTVIKYTKLPDCSLDSKVSWPENNYTLQPRFRRIATLSGSLEETTRSLKSDLVVPYKTTSSNVIKRKIVTIEEDDENNLHPKFSKDVKKPINVKGINRSAETECKNEKQHSQRTTSRLTSSLKCSKEIKASAKNVNTTSSIRKESNTPKVNYKSKYSISQSSTDMPKSRPVKDKETVRSKNNNMSKVSLSRNISTPRESDKEVSKNKTKLKESAKSNYAPFKKTVDKPRLPKSSNLCPKRTSNFLKGIDKNKPVTIIHVPLENTCKKVMENNNSEVSETYVPVVQQLSSKVDCCTEVERDFHLKDVTIGTDAPMPMQNKVTEIYNANDSFCNCTKKTQTDSIKMTFDSLEIPNVTLTKDKNESKEEIVTYHCNSLPNLQSTALNVSRDKNKDEKRDVNFHQGTSFIIGHATVTCTTQQKINFHVSNVLSNNTEFTSNKSPSPLMYPVNVVSIFEKEMKEKHIHENSMEQKDKSKMEYTNCFNELQSLNCSYVLNANKLVKPSDIISTIRVNNGLLQSDYISEQFQRELNFIDSFFESLQYLESYSVSDKCFSESNVNNLINNTSFDVRNSDYGSFLTKLDNGATVDDTETMASKSLCLLNLLIRDEQRRAKNLLFVLKMREDALKDFTKSQILWLENKKKQENTDISTLKKKQRGALLKLQHECGEMQRMRKALLTQSEKRKVALMKTKKNIELTLTNNVSVDQIILGKKKVKRNTADRYTAPLKCFELSSSGCEDSSASKPKSLNQIVEPHDTSMNLVGVTSAEKSIQTGESILETIPVEHATNTAAENFVVVDGGYLNILFHNLSLPQIFSSGKQYEVNEEALKNILNSENSHKCFNESDALEKIMNQIKSPDLESSSPSTARSLVEEMDQYYKGFVEEDKSPIESPVKDSYMMYDIDEAFLAAESKLQQSENHNFISASSMGSDRVETMMDILDPLMSMGPCMCEVSNEVDVLSDREVIQNVGQTGPLPIPAGASSVLESQGIDDPLWVVTKSGVSCISDGSSISSHLSQNEASLSSIASPVQCEAEELRRQQIAIEREIKALEQQQCQLLVVREIPDKPPPPYTPKADARLPRMYVADETTEEKIQKYIADPNTDSCDPTDPFDTFVKDFCIETLERQRSEGSERPWDACNLLPQKPREDAEKLIRNTSTHLLDILTGVAPVVVSGVAGRRSDHIDDILFAEWRRCEPEWTSLHNDEALVKNQIFESIFQKILNETIDEYKHTVLCDE